MDDELNARWENTPLEDYFIRLLERYDTECEVYDSMNCSGSVNGVAMPRNGQEAFLSNKHARELKEQLICAACLDNDIMPDVANYHWRAAIRRLNDGHSKPTNG